MQTGTMFSFYPLNGQAATIQPVIVYLNFRRDF